MTDAAWWKRITRRTTAMSVALTAAVGGAGCRSVESDTMPVLVYPHTPAPPLKGHVSPTAAEVIPASAVGTPDEPAQAIDLGAALRLAGVDNPTINLARERVRQTLAEQLAANALLLPSVNVGGNYYQHRGVLQAASGAVIDVDRQSLYLGGGARAVGGSTVTVPGVWLFAHLGDAVYEPLAARQRVAASRSQAQAVQIRTLRDVATTYLTLAGAEAGLAVLRAGETELAEVVRLTRVNAQKGQGRQADADRAAANADLLRRQIREAEEAVGVAAARLAELLNLSPDVRLQVVDGTVQPVRLLPDGDPLESLVAAAVRSRPEVFARSAEIQEARTRVRQERVRPWVPLVSVGYSGGGFGGSNRVASGVGPLDGRSNFDAVAVWSFGNLGFGNRAQVRRTQADLGQAVAEYTLAVNEIRREVAAAQAESQAAARQLDIAREAVAAAEDAYRLDTQRIRDGFGRPLEALDSFRQVTDSRLEWVRAVVAFDVAQFRLFAAVGNSPLAAAGQTGCEPAGVSSSSNRFRTSSE